MECDGVFAVYIEHMQAIFFIFSAYMYMYVYLSWKILFQNE